jgi:hypothetical protein
MSLANLSIIEKDDLIKKMPKDALKRELREPSGNFPLFLIASRLKDVETMEKESMARQFSQESQGDEPTIAHRLAREVMPQAPISGMAAMPSPQPRPDPQGQMAQALAGPQREMPTVYRNQGGLAALGGAAMPATYEALMQNPEILGLGPFLASSFLDGDDDAPAPTSAPVPQERPILPPTVQVQPNQVPGSNAPVQISGGDTLPTIRAQSGLKGSYPGDASRITAEMLAAAARRRKEGGKPRLYNQGRKVSFEEAIKKGASPAAQMAAMYGIPSAIARQEERVFGGMDTLPPYQPESNPLALRSKGFTSPTRTLPHRGTDESASGLDYLKMMKDIAGDSDDLPTVFAQDGFNLPRILPRIGEGRTMSDLSSEQQLAYARKAFSAVSENDVNAQVDISDALARLGLSDAVINQAGGLLPVSSTPQISSPVSLLNRNAGQQRMADISASMLRPDEMSAVPGEAVQNRPVSSPASAVSQELRGPGITSVQTGELANLPRAPVPVPRGNTVPSLAASVPENTFFEEVNFNPVPPVGAVTSKTLPPPVARSMAPPPPPLAARSVALPPPPPVLTARDIVDKIKSGGADQSLESVSLRQKHDALNRAFDQTHQAFVPKQVAQSAASPTFSGTKVNSQETSPIGGKIGLRLQAKQPGKRELDQVAPDGKDDTFIVTPSPLPPPSSSPVAASTKAPATRSAASQAEQPVGLPSTIENLYQGTLAKEQPKVPTLSGALGSLKNYFPKGRLKGIVDQREEEVKKVESQDPVPKGMKDIRAMMDKRLKALDDSGLPFMTAAAAAIKGNQPTLVALTNAMIGYTAGDEQLKKQGLSLMKDMVDIDSTIATLEAGQRKAEADSRSNLIAAREASIKGDQLQENKLIEAAQAQIKLATITRDNLQKAQISAANSISNYAAMTFKTKAEQERFNTLLEASKAQNAGLSDFQHLERVMKVMKPASINPYTAARFGMAQESVKAKVEREIGAFEEKNMARWVARYNKDNPKNRVSATKSTGEDREKVLKFAYKNGLYGGLATEAAKTAIEKRFNPQSAQSTQGPSGGKDKNKVVDYKSLFYRG